MFILTYKKLNLKENTSSSVSDTTFLEDSDRYVGLKKLYDFNHGPNFLLPNYSYFHRVHKIIIINLLTCK